MCVCVRRVRIGVRVSVGVAVRVKVTCSLGSASAVIREGWATRVSTNGKTHVGDREIATAWCINYALGCVRGRVTGWRRVC